MQLLKDKFGRVHDYIRISVTDRCNLRCVYCMPEEGLTFLPHEKVLSKDEIVSFMELMVKFGIKKYASLVESHYLGPILWKLFAGLEQFLK